MSDGDMPIEGRQPKEETGDESVSVVWHTRDLSAPDGMTEWG